MSPAWEPIIIETTLNNLQPIFDQQVVYKILHQGLMFDFFCFLKSGERQIVISGQDALVMRRAKRLPHFYRWSWYERIPASFITFNDPTLYVHPQLYCGWCQGSLDHFGIEATKDILDVIMERANIPQGGALFYGASAGGFWALMTAALQQGTCVVEIPQTDMRMYPDEASRSALLDACYGTSDINSLPAVAIPRLSVVDWYQFLRQAPKQIIYYQSSRDHAHIDTQMKPFLEGIKRNSAVGGSTITTEIIVKMFSRPDFRGHVPMAVDDSIHAIQTALKDII